MANPGAGLRRGGSLGPALHAAALVLLGAALIAREFRTPEPLPASAPPALFSAERAAAHVKAIAARPHPIGSAPHAQVRDYLVNELRALGLSPELQEATGVGTRYAAAGRVVNVLARLPGRTPGGPALLIAAHYDGVPASPAAGDDASGSAALLEALRALRAGPPLEHDVLALFTDGEEQGLLGAAAFVRGHRWASDAAVVMNFEARGTTGRSMMFETGPGNLDVARELARLSDVTTGSLFVTIYRNLPNDTDLSELSALGRPALNFAFIGGVARYHTAHDDLAHLSLGSLQHHGAQMLALARAFADGPLPRAATPDGVFFTAPLLGVVLYPESYAVPLAVLAALVVLLLLRATARREPGWWRGAAAGLLSTLLVAAACGAGALAICKQTVALHERLGWGGAPSWSGVYAAALGAFALAAASAAWTLARRWCSAASLQCGVLVLWAALSLVLSAKLPGTSFLTTWPALALGLAGLVAGADARSPGAVAARWAAAAIALALLLPVIATAGGYSLPLAGPGGVLTGVLVAVLVWSIGPHLEDLRGGQPWGFPLACAAVAAILFATGLSTVRRNADVPETVNLTYAMNADQEHAVLFAPAPAVQPGRWARAAFEPEPTLVTAASERFGWLVNLQGGGPVAVRTLPRVAFGALDAEVLSDATNGSERRLKLHIVAPPGTQRVKVDGPVGTRVVSVDGIPVDQSRYRRPQRALSLAYSAPGPSGFVLEVVSPAETALALELSAVTTGLPEDLGLSVPPRPDDVVPIQDGDVTVRYRRIELRAAR